MEKLNKKIEKFEDLLVWGRAHKLVLELYDMIKKFPNEEKYRITEQLLRAAISIPTNIAEGFGRYSRKEFIQFLIISRGSAAEVKYLLVLSKDLKYINMELYNKFNSELDEIGKMINGLINSIRSNNH
ncbi:MAG: four helix bundle protein [Ignavibacteria bacterium]|nr:four helix bundle protein [Ignavibacteria bacterium]